MTSTASVSDFLPQKTVQKNKIEAIPKKRKSPKKIQLQVSSLLLSAAIVATALAATPKEFFL